MNQMNFFRNQNKSVEEIFEELRRNLADKDRENQRLSGELRDIKD
jgi:hypothetical protein